MRETREGIAAELDHVFLCVSVGAPEAVRLAAFGLAEGAPNQHPGQGTACRRFFFHNAYLELLWVDDPAQAQSDAVEHIGLWGRWHGRKDKACPFGFCFRPAPNSSHRPPFASWDYCPAYLPASLSIQVGTNSERLTEPGLFYLTFGRRSDSVPENRRPPLTHRSGLCELTRVQLTSPYAECPSPELNSVVNYQLLQLRQGRQFVVELGFDSETQQQSADLRPELPLRFCW